MKQKDALEAELKALSQVLESQGCGMEDPLVDGEGFPRADIDVYQVLKSMPSRSKSNLLVFISTLNRSDTLGMTSEAKEMI